MPKKVFTYLIGGKAGQGAKKAGVAAASLFKDYKRYVMQINDYPSLIRGGHNFSVVSTSTSPLYSHYMAADMVVALDKNSYNIHREHVKESGILVYDKDNVEHGEGIGVSISAEAKNYEKSGLITGVAGLAALAAYLSMSKKELDFYIEQEYSKGEQDNKNYASAIYDEVKDQLKDTVTLKKGDKSQIILEGNQCIALGAAAAGLSMYYAYPMTPASSVLHFFAEHADDLKIAAIHAENEIAVANLAIGSTFAGAKTMVGTSGGGFCLMQEAFSLAGMCESPVLFYLGQRPGPSTGVPTYTSQGDTMMALHPGQGEFPRIVACPGSMEEAFRLTGELLDLAWQFQTPAILLSEKHLAESSMSVNLDPDKLPWVEPLMHKGGEFHRYKDTDSGVSPLLFPPSEALIKWNSYEHDEQGLTTEEAGTITQMCEKRKKKLASLIEHLGGEKTVNIYGGGKQLIYTFGSTTMSVREAIEYGDIDATIVQPIYLQPFPIWAVQKYTDRPGIVIEQNWTGQLESLLKEKAGAYIVDSIQQYDGRPFDPAELSERIKEVM